MKKSLVTAFLSLFLSSCIMDKTSDIVGDELYPDLLTDKQLSVIDTMRSQTVNLDSIVLPNGAALSVFMHEFDSILAPKFLKSTIDPYVGISPNQIKSYLVSRFLASGVYLTNRTYFQYPKEGQNKPAQNGLAYSYGAKDYTIRAKPNSGECKEEVYGLDCSGMVYHLLKSGNLKTAKSISAYDQHQPSFLQKALKEFPSMNNLKVVNRGKLVASSFEAGDIIYWSKLDGEKGSHIGIVLKEFNGSLKVYQSNGTNFSKYKCEDNFGLNRGPRTLDLANNYWFSSESAWEIVRINVENFSSEVINNNNLQVGGCYPGGSPAIDENGNPKIFYPYTIWAQACFGNPPYLYRLNNKGSWTSKYSFIVNKPGKYIVTVRDNLGYEASRTFDLW